MGSTKTIIIGSDLPEQLHKELILRAGEVGARVDIDDNYQVIELVEFENLRILQKRQELAGLADIQAGLENDERREQIRKDVLTFIKRVGANKIHAVSKLREETTFSWKQFKTLLDSWELFGFLKYEDDKKSHLRFLVSESDIKENILAGIQGDMDLLVQKLRAVSKQFNPEERKKLLALERKLKLEINVNKEQPAD